MKTKQHIFLYLFAMCNVIFCFAQVEVAFNKANEFYNQEKFNEAIDEYESILENGEHSAELYFNLGNAHYKLNNVAPSIYYYEKALQLKPNDKEIKNNIAFARNMTLDNIEAVPEVGFAKLTNSITKILTYESWAKLTVVLMVLFVVSFLLYYFYVSTFKKRILFISGLTFFILLDLSLLMAFKSYDLNVKHRPAIVFAEETQVKSEPNLRGTLNFTLHQGTKVQVLESIDDWNKIKLADGKTGWLQHEDIKLINNQ